MENLIECLTFLCIFADLINKYVMWYHSIYWKYIECHDETIFLKFIIFDKVLVNTRKTKLTTVAF